MATRQTNSAKGKANRPVTASPTARPPKAPAKPAATRGSNGGTAASTAAGTSGRTKPAGGQPAGSTSAGRTPAGGTPAGAARSGAGTARAAAGASAPESAPTARTGLAGRWSALVGWAGGGTAFATWVVSLLGLADSIYLTYQHFAQASSFAGCSDSGAINCVAVTTSPWSYLPPHSTTLASGQFGVPVSVLGLAFFVFMVVVNSPWGWRAPRAVVHWARLASVVVGIVFVLYLIFAELFRINAICVYCTGVHVLTFILFGLVVTKAALSGVKPAPGTR